jgi:predicted CoA-substrate-specific enzyme activase
VPNHKDILDSSSGATVGHGRDEIYLGIDIGAVNARLAVLDDKGQLIHLDEERTYQGPAAAVEKLIDRAGEQVSLDIVAGSGVTGSGRHIFDGKTGWQLFTSPYAAITGLLHDHPDARTIISVGGQSSLVIGLGGGLDSSWRVARSPLCAAGTGRFLEQQASRLGIPIEDFGRHALEWTKAPPRVAARCSVFAKSDLIHLQQKGWPISAMLAGLSDSIARMIQAQWRDEFVAPIYCIGGVAANEGVVRALSTVLGATQVIVPSEHAGREAIGAARLAQNNKIRPTDLYPSKTDESDVFYISRNLKKVMTPGDWQPTQFGSHSMDVYLGVDVGSTSTKAAVIDPSGNVLAKTYLMTAGQPLEAVKKVMANLAEMAEGKVRVLAVGVTGSGRYLVGNFIGADLIKNEITAQTRAAMQIDPDVSTIFELGGQDSKFVYLENRTVLDYQMNKACAAGTGSFVDELAEQLGISTRTGEFARLAFLSPNQLDLGEKCTAFMSQAVTSAQHSGVPIEVITSSLATSLAKNYLSKVVGSRRIGDRVLLTGAVFYNEAIVSAFEGELPGKKFVVPLHKEVTGAIGAALLAKEAMHEGRVTSFKGFSRLANESYKLTNFNCHKCENTCAISVMTAETGERLFYGSRCDLFDAETSGEKTKGRETTPFTTRETLLFENYDSAKGSGASIGVPRALLAHDLAPMLTGFLNALGLRIRYSSATNKQIIETSLEHAYTDSCFPIKLLHGHVAELIRDDVDFVLIPNAIRMGRKDGEEDQRYSCPLVQAAPYIIRSVFHLGDKLLDPVIDFSRGDEAVIRSFIDVGQRLGFSERDSAKAAREGIARQREFEAKLRETGQRMLDELADNPDRLGVVLLSRAYNAQDSGANLGMAEELSRLGVVPIPIDFLPLDTVDVKEITDRPYWNYERKILAASKLIGESPQLFGLFLSNFGCGPNSFIQNIVEDMMGGKPLGQIELDEHAAEAGYITRLEALVDTIRSFRLAGLQSAPDPSKYVRRVPTSVRSGETVLIPRMADHAAVVAGGMRYFGVNAIVLPESDDRSMSLSRDVTSGRECLPFRDSLGVFLRMAEDGLLPKRARALMAGSYGPCRLGKYAQEQQKILSERGIDLEVLTTVSNNAYTDLGLGVKFELLAWKGIVATDLLQKMLWMTRPYERYRGQSNQAYNEFLERFIRDAERGQKFDSTLREAVATFRELRDSARPPRPLVGINGEIYLRANEFCNKGLVELCEANGLEAEVAPMAEWIKYITLRNIEDAWGNKDIRKLSRVFVRKLATEHYEGRLTSWVKELLHSSEPSPSELMRTSSQYLPSRNGSEAVLSIGSGVHQLRDPRYAGVISVMPHGCMPGGIVAAFAEQISKEYGNKPWISLTYDGFPDKVNAERIADFAQMVRVKH